MIRLTDIHFRDPFILPVPMENTYYMYGTQGTTAWDGKPDGFDVYRSCDLLNWEGPIPVFRPDPGFWSDHYWAPEVHHVQDRFYMFASFKAKGMSRAVQVLVANHPLGPFEQHSLGPITPKAWECLDGTLYMENDGTPWLVFCRDWLQVTDGEVYAAKLADTLDRIVSEPQLLFRASEAPWVKPNTDGGFVTDGPFLHRMDNGRLLLLWSSQGEQGFTTGIARSVSGRIIGPWVQEELPLAVEDGGHGMLFRDWYNNLLLAIHAPNHQPNERPTILRVEESAESLEIK
ncbi:glycoside hydrolase family 43 protein [Paenibacillus guangzhouensis]|uniref:glycoside hydrolase family 43 protein n=1 Tax=Paenibacillus guangzhouensis TaxID=1473112 RepID=UPI001266B9F1|nr:glycoside hydrolase family 43 protein [Paenibacillus guangzhouensis]